MNIANMTTRVCCDGNCDSDIGKVQGLRCRFNQLTVPGEYDAEESCVVCEIPQNLVPGIACEYQVLAPDGRVIYRNKGDHVRAVNVDGGNHKDAANVLPEPAASAVFKQLSWLDRLLPVWIVAAMVGGVVLGYFAPSVRARLQVAHIAGVSLPIAVGLWLMMLPVLTKVQYELLNIFLLQKAVGRQFAISFALNWVLGPALMTGLAWACLPDLPSYRNGVIMVGLARCIAMVLIWNELARGDAELCAVLVAFNSVLQIVLYAPLAVFYLQVVSKGGQVGIGFWPVAKSVLLFLGVPLVAGILVRYALLSTKGKVWFESKFMPKFGPVALVALLYTIVVMFVCQADKIVNEIGQVARVAVPMLGYFMLMFFGSLAVSWQVKSNYAYAVTQAFTAASNNFELAIAVAVATFGIQSNEALAATVGPLIEVPALLGLVYVALWLNDTCWAARDTALKVAGRFPVDLRQAPAGSS